MSTLRLNYRAYVALVFGAGMIALGAWTRHTFGVLAAPLPSALQTCVWLAMLAVAVVAPIPLPRRGGSASLTPAFELSAVFVFGPAVACWLAVVARIVANLVEEWDSRTTFSVGQAALATGAAGVVYVGLHGPLGTAFTTGGGGAILVASAVHLAVRHALALGAGALGAPELAAERRVDARDALLMESLLVPFAVPLALAEVSLGWVIAPVFAGPLILARHAGMLWKHCMRKHLDTVSILTTAVDAADPFARGRSARVAKMCVRVGRAFHISGKELDELEYAALLHDIGRTAIHQEVFIKAGKLSPDEESMLRMHPNLGAEIIERMGFFPAASRIVLAHHERPDGRGYPKGLAAADVPLASRIVMVAAAFDAMTTDRPYRLGMDPSLALEELLANAGTQFYADVVEVFIDLYSRDVLFDDLDPASLEQYRVGHGNSRAIEEHLRRRGLTFGGSTGARPATLAAADVLIGAEDSEVRLLSCETAGLRIRMAGATDVGCVRGNNEDSFGMRTSADSAGRCLFVVADGMGGAAAGEVASHLAVETVQAAFFASETPHDTAGAALRHAIEAAHEAVRSRAAADIHSAGMGTTCVAAAIDGMDLFIGHAGDSRAYLLANGTVERLTQDHNVAEEILVASGIAAGQNARHILTRCLGQETQFEVHIGEPRRLGPGQQVVLCSDGMSNLVDDEEILDAVSSLPAEEACTALVRLALQRGAPDNVTVVVVRTEAI